MISRSPLQNFFNTAVRVIPENAWKSIPLLCPESFHGFSQHPEEEKPKSFQWSVPPVSPMFSSPHPSSLPSSPAGHIKHAYCSLFQVFSGFFPYSSQIATQISPSTVSPFLTAIHETVTHISLPPSPTSTAIPLCWFTLLHGNVLPSDVLYFACFYCLYYIKRMCTAWEQIIN